jgi:hypothetical protein
VVDDATVAWLIKALEQVPDSPNVRRRESVYAIRNLLDIVPEARQVSRNPALLELARSVLGPGARPVRGVLFDKTPDANWKLMWHQDLSVAVRQQLEVPGYGPWSMKGEVVHVQPPVQVLERMLTIRLHLDDCDVDNGPLKVIPGSHRDGRLDAGSTIAWRVAQPEVVCTVPSGGALLMRPLLLHSSGQALSPRHRRVIHLDYAPGRLAEGLEWHEPDEDGDWHTDNYD